MAYLDLRDAGLAALGTMSPGRVSGAAASAPAPASGFSALEWLVVALAERDRPASLAQPGRIAVALHRLFGGGGQPRLANPRLEALRRFAIMAWHGGGNVAPSEIAAFRAAGFTGGQLETLVESIFARRGGRRPGAAS